jgi:hypothetical protein
MIFPKDVQSVNFGIVFNIGGFDGPDSLLAYLEKWRMQLWDLAFSAFFKDATPFKKNNVFADYHGANLLLKREIHK